MPNVVRFVLSTALDLPVPGVGQFIDGVLDVDANNLRAVTRARYLTQPFRAVEIGIVDSATPPPSLPAPVQPPAPNTDPYPQYLTPAEARALVTSDPDVLAAQRAAFDGWAEDGGVVTGGTATRLPLMVIETAGAAEITSKEVYVNGTVSVTGADVPDYTGATQIRGRGNYTWGLAKKPYRVKLTTAAPLLGLPAERDWALLANHTDATLLNTALAMDIGKQADGLDWTPNSAFVDLVLNGTYLGVYQLIENTEISTAPRIPGPIATGTSGDTLTGTYSLEIDPRYGMAEPGFTTGQGIRVIYDDPKGEVAEQAAYITTWIGQFESALYGTQFKDSTAGYLPYIDRDSFIDWYLIQELASNQDSAFSSSCKLYKTRDSAGGKLHMGPLWDFDIAFGSVISGDHPATGLYTRPDAKWLHRMFADPVFVTALNARWAAMVTRLNDPETGYAAVLDRLDAEIAASREENYKRWGITPAWISNVPAKKAWIAKRIAWLTTEFTASTDGSKGDNTSYATPLTNTVAPAITGTATTGQTLTVSNGTWSATPDSYTRQWKRAGANISGATGTTYVLQVADEGQAITCTVTATKAGYSNGTATSNTVAAAAAAPTAPGQVTDLTVGTPTSTGVPLSWTAPANGGTAITDYVVQYKLTSEPTTWGTFADGTSTNTSATVTGLTASTSYDFRVAAVNAAGTGTNSAIVTASTAAGGGATTPSSLTGLSAWYKADAGVTAAAGSASAWADQSGKLNNGAEGTVAKQPLVGAATQNSLPLLGFTGAADRGFQSNTSVGFTSADAGLTIIALVRPSSQAGEHFIFGMAGSGGSSVGYRFNNGKQQLTMPGVADLGISTTTVASGTTAVIAAVVTPTSLKLFLNGTADGTGTYSTKTFSTGILEIGRFGAGNNLDGYMGELVVYNRPLTDAEVKQIQTYLGTRWGVTVAP